MSETATHVASGKVREIYALDDERLLLVASDRISTFDVVLPTEIPDKGRVLTGLSGFWFARTARDRPESPARRARGRTLDGVRAARDAADRVRRARLPLRLRLEGLRRDGRGVRSPAARGARRVAAAAAADLHARRRRPTTGHDENIDRAAAVELDRRGALRRGRGRSRSRSTRSSPSYARKRGIILADTKLEFGLDQEGRLVLGDEAFTPDSSRFWPADEYGRAQRRRRSTSSSCATTASRSAGTRRRPARSCPTTSSPARAPATSRRSSS